MSNIPPPPPSPDVAAVLPILQEAARQLTKPMWHKSQVINAIEAAEFFLDQAKRTSLPK
jgi:hypothetical protein